MSWIRLLKRAWALLLLAGVPAAFAQSGELAIAWDPTPDTGVQLYRIRYGTNPANLTNSVDVPSSQTQAQLGGLTGGVEYTIRVSAVRPSGCESSPSTELKAFPVVAFGPECTSVSLSGVALQESTVSLTVQGSGFEPGINVNFFQGNVDVGGSEMISVVSQNLVNDSTLQLTLQAGSLTPVGGISMELQNADPTQTSASCLDAFLVLFNLNRADINSSLRVEGADLALLGAGFGTFDRVCAVDSPKTSARGDRCDGEDDCGGTVGGSDYCTAKACVAAAPVAAGVACRRESDCGGNASSSYCQPTPYHPNVDLDGNGIVDGIDLALLQPLFGRNVGP